MIIYYKPSCSKCSEAIELLENNHCEFEMRDYLSYPPSVEELSSLIEKLGCKPFYIIRKSEKLFLEQFAGRTHTDAEWIDILTKNPTLIERPIVIEGDRAVIGRPPATVLNLLKY